jgi:hypothetical protein
MLLRLKTRINGFRKFATKAKKAHEGGERGRASRMRLLKNIYREAEEGR